MILPTNKSTFAQMSTLLCALFLVGEGIAQPDTLWTRGYGMYGLYDLQITNEGNYILGGSVYENNNHRYADFNAKAVNSLGRELWENVMVDTGGWYSEVASVCLNSGAIYLVGSGATAASGSGFVASLNMDGDSLWRIPFGGRRATLLTSILDPNGGVFAAGNTYELSEHGGADGYLLNVDSVGEERFHRFYGGQGHDYFKDMLRSSDSGFIMAGQTASYGGGIQFYLVKTDSTGDEEWSGAYGGENTPDVASAVGQLPDGGYVMAGWTYPTEGTSNDMLVIRVNSEGEELWSRQFGDSINTERFHDLVVLPDGDIVLLGNSSDRPTARLMRITSDGDVRWEARYDRLSRGILDCIVLLLLGDGSYAFAGTRSGGAFMVKTEPDTTGQVNVTRLLDPAFPSQFAFSAPYPNPFNSTLSINYEIPSAGPMTLRLFDVSGSHVETLVNEFQPTGSHSIIWNANGCPAGLYFLRLESGILSATQSITLVK